MQKFWLIGVTVLAIVGIVLGAMGLARDVATPSDLAAVQDSLLSNLAEEAGSLFNDIQSLRSELFGGEPSYSSRIDEIIRRRFGVRDIDIDSISFSILAGGTHDEYILLSSGEAVDALWLAFDTVTGAPLSIDVTVYGPYDREEVVVLTQSAAEEGFVIAPYERGTYRVLFRNPNIVTAEIKFSATYLRVLKSVVTEK